MKSDRLLVFMNATGEGPEMRASFPGFRLGAFYFLFFAAVGGFMPYWALYLESLGYDAATIGALMALMMATRIVAPNLWGWVADRRGARMGVIRVGALAAVASFALGALGERAAFPGPGHHPLQRVLERGAVSVRGGDPGAPWRASGALFAHPTVGVRRLRGGQQHHRSGARVPWSRRVALAAARPHGQHCWHELPGDRAGRGVIAAPATTRCTGALPVANMVCLLLACALMQASHGPYYVFFSIHLEGLGYSGGEIGALWALAVVAEVALFAGHAACCWPLRPTCPCSPAASRSPSPERRPAAASARR